jgi:holo-[acyl-carrier protein] synthase
MTQEIQLLNFRNVVAHGVDVVDTADFSRFVNTQADGFLDRYFTSGELAAADEGGNRVERLASRFAVKEAVLKALGTGWGDGVAFTDVEVGSQRRGAPSIRLYRRLAAVADEQGIGGWLVSASHTASIAMASVIALAVAQPKPSEPLDPLVT